jgi:GDPmannose 4,6-dehydratase
MLQQDQPDDYVIATGKSHTVREFVERSFAEIGVRIRREGGGVEEKGYNAETGKCIVEIDPIYFRPAEVDFLLGDSSKARTKL